MGKIEQVVALKSKFDLEERRIFFGRARLLPDRIILKGLGYKRVILLSTINEIRWSSELLAIGTDDGDQIELIIQSSALWKFELQARCNLQDVKSGVDLSESSRTPENEPEEFPGDLFDEPLAQRESTYRVKSSFAEDRPKTNR